MTAPLHVQASSTHSDNLCGGNAPIFVAITSPAWKIINVGILGRYTLTGSAGYHQY